MGNLGVRPRFQHTLFIVVLSPPTRKHSPVGGALFCSELDQTFVESITRIRLAICPKEV